METKINEYISDLKVRRKKGEKLGLQEKAILNLLKYGNGYDQIAARQQVAQLLYRNK